MEIFNLCKVSRSKYSREYSSSEIFSIFFYDAIVTLPGKQISLKSLSKDQLGCVIDAFVIIDEPQSSITINNKYTLSNNTLKHGVSLQVIKEDEGFQTRAYTLRSQLGLLSNIGNPVPSKDTGKISAILRIYNIVVKTENYIFGFRVDRQKYLRYFLNTLCSFFDYDQLIDVYQYILYNNEISVISRTWLTDDQCIFDPLSVYITDPSMRIELYNTNDKNSPLWDIPL